MNAKLIRKPLTVVAALLVLAMLAAEARAYSVHKETPYTGFECWKFKLDSCLYAGARNSNVDIEGDRIQQYSKVYEGGEVTFHMPFGLELRLLDFDARAQADLLKKADGTKIQNASGSSRLTICGFEVDRAKEDKVIELYSNRLASITVLEIATIYLDLVVGAGWTHDTVAAAWSRSANALPDVAGMPSGARVKGRTSLFAYLELNAGVELLAMFRGEISTSAKVLDTGLVADLTALPRNVFGKVVLDVGSYSAFVDLRIKVYTAIFGWKTLGTVRLLSYMVIGFPIPLVDIPRPAVLNPVPEEVRMPAPVPVLNTTPIRTVRRF